MSKLKTMFNLMKKKDNQKLKIAFMHNFSRSKISRLVPDKKYIGMWYKAVFGRKIDLKNPKTYNEKLQWLKIYNRNPEYTKLVDKQEVKKHIADKIGEKYVIPTLAVWDSVDDINIDSLPEQFVLKCTHDSGSIYICTDKTKFDLKAVKEGLRKKLKYNMYWWGREWPYKNVKPRIIAEKYMVDESGTELKDYKFFCFGGKAKYLFVATDRYNPDEETKFDFFDLEFNHLPFTNGHPNANRKIEKPKGFDKMVELAEILSENMPHARVDFYDINGEVYFGEITFSHWNGLVPFEPEEWDYKLGKLINLSGESIVKE